MLEYGILATIPDTVVNGGGTTRLPNTVNIGFKYIEGEAILFMLQQARHLRLLWLRLHLRLPRPLPRADGHGPALTPSSTAPSASASPAIPLRTKSRTVLNVMPDIVESPARPVAL